MSSPSLDIDLLLRSHNLADTDDVSTLFEVILDYYRAPLYRLCFSILNDHAEAEDALQETIISVVFHLGQYQNGTNFKAWLFTIAVNHCRGVLRRRAVKKWLTLRWAEQTLASPGIFTPEEFALRDESSRQLWQAVGELGEKHRLVLLLNIVDGLSIPEVASVLGINPKTAYSRLYDALRRLRRLLGENIHQPKWRGKELVK